MLYFSQKHERDGENGMKKTVYSLVLSEDVVAEIDRLAYHKGTNRSNMINQILAEYVSYVTPEKRMRDIFGRLEALLDGRDSFHVQLTQSDSLFSLRSALDFKYNPTVRYSVELYRTPSPEGALGELRVALRTQNSTLLLYLMQFYKLWNRVEENIFGGPVHCRLEDGGKYLRQLRLHAIVKGADANSAGSETLGELIAAYIRTFDAALKAYFYHLSAPSAAVAEVERIYRSYLAASTLVL